MAMMLFPPEERNRKSTKFRWEDPEGYLEEESQFLKDK
jgi:hypothetical protein